MPPPHELLCRLLFSPVPTQTTLASFGAMATSPMETTSWSLKRDSQVVPWFIVFQRPPVAVAT